MATDQELAWAAGLFDGVGQIKYSRNLLGLKLGCPDFELVVRFWNIVGFGSVKQARGRVHFYEWTLSKQKDCRELMIMLWPHLSERRRQRWNRVLEARELAFYPRTCPSCGSEYKPVRKTQVCCSGKCAAKYSKSRKDS